MLMSSLVPLQLKQDSDINASVKLHVLCRECQRICQNAHTFQIQISTAKTWVPRVMSKDIFKHHQTSVELEASARRGCHLCSLLYDAFLPHLEFIRLLESKLAIAKSHKIKRRKSSYKLEINADSSTTDTAITFYISASFRFSPEPPRYHPQLTDPDTDSDEPELSKSNHPRFLLSILPANVMLPLFSQEHGHISTASNASFQQVIQWTDTCLTEHALCRQVSQLPYRLPTRVIDVGSQGASRAPRLYLSQSKDINVQYLALSHCWGGAEIMKLAVSTLKALQECIEMDDLPLTFKHAIEITRRLGYRYLWIDSLCIVQDSPEDWKTESLTMTTVYRNSTLTISALWGSDSHTGCFVERSPLAIFPCRIVKTSRYEFFAEPSGQLNLSDNAGPLLKRAWVLQERLLSPRVLFFGKDGLHWECHECEANETWPQGEGEGGYQYHTVKPIRRGLYGVLKELSTFHPAGNKESVEQFYRVWGWIIGAYTAAKLTFPSDILIAISGLVNVIKARTGLTFFHGHWKELLPLDLLWHVEGHAGRIKSVSQPTWSWASLQGIERNAEHGPVEWRRGRTGFPEQYQTVIEVVSLDTLPSKLPIEMDSDMPNAIVLHGALLPAVLTRADADHASLEGDRAPSSAEQTEFGRLASNLWVDITLWGRMNVHCLVMEQLREEFAPKQRLTGLLLRRENMSNAADAETYERIGYWEHYHVPGINKLVDLRDGDWKTVVLV